MGIRKIFKTQKDKFLPLPEYTLSNHVELTVFGDIESNEYTNQLFLNKNLDLGTVFLIDKKQKRFPIDDKDYKYVIISFIEKNRRVSKNDIKEILLHHLDDQLNFEQKQKKINNLISGLSKENVIKNISKSKKKAIWILA